MVAVLAVGVLAARAEQGCGVSDTVYFNGRILTGVGLEAVERDGVRPEYVEAMGTNGDRVSAVGTKGGVVACGLTADVRWVDLRGAFVMPGFDDAHTHMAMAGQQRLTVDLDDVASLAAMQAKVKAYAAGLPAGAWILGGGWDHTKWASKRLPTRAEMDAVSGGHPLFLERTDGHIAVVNSAALKAAGIGRGTVAPAGAAIDVDAGGEPTGIVREAAALAMVQGVIPKPDAAERRKALALSMQDALSHGVTSVQDFSTWEDFLVLEAMEKDGQLPVRFSEWVDFNLPVVTLEEMQASHPKGDPWLHTGMLKGFMDGSLGSRTAAMAEPYSDDAKNSGLPRYEQGKLDAMAAEREAAGFQLGFHAIGDRANAMALDALGSAEDGYFAQVHSVRDRDKELEARCHAGRPAGAGESCVFLAVPPPPRNRIEHAQVLLPGDFERFEKLGVIASMQPSHLLTDMAWAEQRIGAERAKYAYAWRSMLEHGVTLAFGTDYPVESIDPMRGLYSAVTRMNVEGTHTFHPEQKLTMAEALYAYTQASAYAEFAEKTKGRLESGFLADFVVMDRDLTTAKPQEILKAKVLRTVVGGVTRYEASGAVMAAPRAGKADGD